MHFEHFLRFFEFWAVGVALKVVPKMALKANRATAAPLPSANGTPRGVQSG